MRKFVSIGLALSLLLAWTGAARPGDEDGRPIINKAIAAAGGEAKLANFQTATFKEKGTYYGMGDGLPYTGVYTQKLPSHFKMEIVGLFTIALDGDKGWTKEKDEIKDLPKDRLDVEIYNNKAGWITTLLPLKDKAFTVTAVPAGDKHTSVVVRRKDWPSVKLYFDKKTDLLVKCEYKTKSPEQKYKDIAQELHYSDFKTVDGCQVPHHILIKQDGKTYVEADVTEMKAAKFDGKAFAKPESK